VILEPNILFQVFPVANAHLQSGFPQGKSLRVSQTLNIPMRLQKLGDPADASSTGSIPSFARPNSTIDWEINSLSLKKPLAAGWRNLTTEYQNNWHD
jgi:hypothetical protein